MKIAIPISNGILSPHFGHCDEFAIIEVEPQNKSIIGIDTLKAPPHEPGLLPRLLHEMGVNIVIAGGMGAKAQQFFSQLGIEVIVGAPAMEPRTIVENYLEGRLQTGENVCNH